jgi:hypothetical protein
MGERRLAGVLERTHVPLDPCFHERLLPVLVPPAIGVQTPTALRARKHASSAWLAVPRTSPHLSFPLKAGRSGEVGEASRTPGRKVFSPTSPAPGESRSAYRLRRLLSDRGRRLPKDRIPDEVIVELEMVEISDET